MLQKGDRVEVLAHGKGTINHVYSGYYEIMFDVPIHGHRILNCDPSIVRLERLNIHYQQCASWTGGNCTCEQYRPPMEPVSEPPRKLSTADKAFIETVREKKRRFRIKE